MVAVSVKVHCPTFCWTFCRLRMAIVPWQAPRIPLHSLAGAVKRLFALHEQSPVVVQLATMRIRAALEGPLRVGLINFLEIAPQGLVHFCHDYSAVFYEILWFTDTDGLLCVCDVQYDLIVDIFLLFSDQARCLVNTRSTLWPQGHPRAVSELIAYYSVVFQVLLITPKYLQKPFSIFQSTVRIAISTSCKWLKI